MIILHDDDRDPRDEELFAALRAEYNQPSDSSYWAFLERRIMGRITSEGAREWWSYFPAWSRVGLAAAALALLVAGVAAWQTREAHRMSPHGTNCSNRRAKCRSSNRLAASVRRQREATLRYLIAR